jgi:hypothetical protein
MLGIVQHYKGANRRSKGAIASTKTTRTCQSSSLNSRLTRKPDKLNPAAFRKWQSSCPYFAEAKVSTLKNMTLAAHSPQEMTEKYAQPCQVSGRPDPKIELVPDKRRLTFAERQFPGLGELKTVLRRPWDVKTRLLFI